MIVCHVIKYNHQHQHITSYIYLMDSNFVYAIYCTTTPLHAQHMYHIQRQRKGW